MMRRSHRREQMIKKLTEKEIRVPEEIGLAIFDELPWFSYVSPSLTGVAQSSFQLGETATQLLVNQMGKRS